MEKDDCIFCKIVAGVIPATKVYEDEHTLAFLDIHPVNPGHTLVIPKDGTAHTIFDITPETWSAVAEAVRKVAKAAEKALGATGVNLLMNNRETAGQIVDHPHVHVIPRFTGDGLTHWPHKSYKEGEADEVAQKIRLHIQK